MKVGGASVKSFNGLYQANAAIPITEYRHKQGHRISIEAGNWVLSTTGEGACAFRHVTLPQEDAADAPPPAGTWVCEASGEDVQVQVAHLVSSAEIC